MTVYFDLTIKDKEVAIEVKLTSGQYEARGIEKQYFTQITCNEMLMLNK